MTKEAFFTKPVVPSPKRTSDGEGNEDGDEVEVLDTPEDVTGGVGEGEGEVEGDLGISDVPPVQSAVAIVSLPPAVSHG